MWQVCVPARVLLSHRTVSESTCQEQKHNPPDSTSGSSKGISSAGVSGAVVVSSLPVSRRVTVEQQAHQFALATAEGLSPPSRCTCAQQQQQGKLTGAAPVGGRAPTAPGGCMCCGTQLAIVRPSQQQRSAGAVVLREGSDIITCRCVAMLAIVRPGAGPWQLHMPSSRQGAADGMVFSLQAAIVC